MTIGRYIAREITKELDNRSREFYEFVMPAIDIVEDNTELIVTIDLPGFAKKNINLKINGNVLTIIAKKEDTEDVAAAAAAVTVYQRHRPIRIEKKVILPISVKEDEKVVGKATYVEGVVTLKIPMASMSTNIPIS